MRNCSINTSVKNAFVFACRLFVLCLVFTIQIRSQYRFDSWTTDNGLPQNSILSVLQTSDGYLWMTTSDGLVRYDGVRFTVFNKSNTKEISSNRFTRLYEAKDKTLWAGTEDGGLVRYKDGVFKSFTTSQGLSGNQVTWIYGNDVRLLIETSSGIRYLQNESFSPVPEQTLFDKPKIYLSPSGTLWLIHEKGIRQIKNNVSRDFEFVNNATLLESSSPYEDRSGNLWLPMREGLLFFNGNDFTRYDKIDGVPSEPLKTVRTVFEDKDGVMWFAVAGGLLNFKGAKFHLITSSEGLPEAEIRSITQDREGTFWLGTTSSGLIKMTRQFITSLSVKDGLPFKNVYPVFQDRKGDVWFGSSPGLARYSNGVFKDFHIGRIDDKDVAKRKLVYPAGSNNRSATVTALSEDKEGHLWVGFIDGVGAFENGEFKDYTSLVTFTDSQGYVKRSTVWAIHQDKDGTFWFATEKGLFRKDKTSVTHFTKNEGLPSDDIKAIHESKNGAMWFATYGGLVELREGKFIPHTTNEGLASNRVRSLYEDKDGVLWIGTYDGGLSRFKDGKFTNYTVEKGLFNHGVFQILEDERSNFWMTCNNGIYRVSHGQLNDFADGKTSYITSIAYGKPDGMLNAEANGGCQPAGIKSADGKFWFPTQDGVAIIDPESVSINPLPPPVLIEGVFIDRELVANNAFQSAIRNPQSAITLNPNQNNLEIAYAGLSFIKPEQVRFRYKLEGLDPDWIEAGTRRTAYYSYIPPGSYTFRVIAANADGVWNEVGASLQIKILPPFYRTWWFLILSLCVVCLAAFLFYRKRISALEKARAAQQAFSQQLIESQESERKRIAVELHDSLGQSLIVIKNRALMSLKSPENHERLLAQMEEISEATTEAISEVRGIARNLHPYQLDHLGLTSALEAMIESVKDASAIEFSSEIDQLDGVLTKDAEINLYRIIQEAVNNILKHSAATKARISLKKHSNEMELLIEDNGKGFVQNNGVDKKRGLGLTGIKERAKMLNAQHEIRSDFGTGTTIRLQIKIEQKNG